MYFNKTEAINSFENLLKTHDVGSPDQAQLLIGYKNERRRIKGSPYFINAITLSGTRELESFLEWLKQPKASVRIDVLFYHLAHWFYFSVNSTSKNVTFFIFDQYNSNTYSVNLIKTIRHLLPNSTIYSYASNEKLNTAVQKDFNCFWFALQSCFNMSKIDIFSVLQRDSVLPHNFLKNNLAFQKEYLKLCSSYGKYFKNNVKLIFPSTLPAEMAALFIPCQSSAPFNALNPAAHTYLVSSKQQSLQEVINRKHQKGQMLLDRTNISNVWPNNVSGEDIRHHNHAIIYFKIHHLNMIINWLKKTPDHIQNSIVTRRLDFDRLTQPFSRVSLV